jgi:hypothetical protein
VTATAILDRERAGFTRGRVEVLAVARRPWLAKVVDGLRRKGS